jgi:ribonucleotide monophosphatase NagD (HAD superfamily)
VAVVLITNAPRPRAGVIAQLDAILACRESAWDRVVTSGDVTRELIRSGPRRVFHHRPRPRPLRSMTVSMSILSRSSRPPSWSAPGFFDDETETPDDYAEMLRRLRMRATCRSSAPIPTSSSSAATELIWCAGALARDYGQLGGRTLVVGQAAPADL